VNGTGITDLMYRIVAASTEASAPAAEITLPGTPASVSVARRLVRDALPGCPRADDLMLAVSELATNCIAHTASGRGGTFTVRVRAAPGWARVEVIDDGPAAGPSTRRNGWGLPIVAGVTDRSGGIVRSDGQRTAWAEVTWLP
jgi:anti-sigma regulatory factor (Ser/Thr protein kinase)